MDKDTRNRGPSSSGEQQRRHHHITLRVILAVLLMFSFPVTTLLAQSPTRSHTQGRSLQQGISYAAWWSGQYSTPDAELSLRELASTGADWIGLVVTGYQERPDSTTIDYTSESTPTDDELIHVIEQAHALGLHVMLKPHLDLRNERENDWWRGQIGNEFTSEAEWAAWFASYREFITHYATLAQMHDVEQFAIGAELLGTTHRSEEWREIVAGVRSAYDGPILYAALHGGEETSISWWDTVDYIGVNAYYQLSPEDEPAPTIAELETQWQKPIQTMATLAENYGKSIVLTEIGYRSHDGTTSHPWDSWIEAPLDMQEQADAYEAAFRQLYDQPWLVGIFWWTWYADRFQSGPCDDGFSPYQKPAGRVLRTWYNGEPAPTRQTLFPDNDTSLALYDDGLGAGWKNWSWDATSTAVTDTVYAGTEALSVTLDSWGALSLWHSSFSAKPYHWIEFYVHGSAASVERLKLNFETEDETTLPTVPIVDCRYANTTPDGEWLHVRIPLHDAAAARSDLTRVSLQDKTGAGADFVIDEIRLVGATPPATSMYLPAIGTK